MVRGRRPNAREAFHHGDLRRALLDEGLRALAEGGPENLSMRELARRAGVSPAAPYRHFQDRDELIGAIAAEAVDLLLAEMRLAVAGAAAHPLARFRATGVAVVRFAVAQPAHFRAMSLASVQKRMPGPARERLDAFYAHERQLLKDAQRAGLLAPLDIEQLGLAARSLMHGLAHLIVEERPDLAADVDAAAKVAGETADILGKGVLPRAASAPARKKTKRTK